MWLFLAFLLVPIIEIALFIQVGGLIGLWPTLLIVIATAILGTYLVRSQGRRALDELRGSFSQLRDPTRPLAHGAMILFSGALLLTPGFFTDAVGFLLLIPAVRDWVMREAGQRVRVERFSVGPDPRRQGQAEGRQPHRHPGVIDGEWEEVSDAPRRRAPPRDAEAGDAAAAEPIGDRPGGRPGARSGWTRTD